MKKILVAFVISLIFFQLSYSQVKSSKTPTWVQEQAYKTDPNIDTDEIDEGTLFLLYSSQINIPKQEVYSRKVIKITDNVGIQSASTISASYDPVYQSIWFHKISIIRDGKTMNKLNISNFQTMRRESNADNYMYDGTLDALLNISDVRTGDIVDYSYTVRGFNPIHKGYFSSIFYLNDVEPIGKLYFRYLSNKKLNFKNLNTDITPIISEKNGFNYTWTKLNTKRIYLENNTPNWRITYETVLISNYNNWKEVVDWGVNVYAIKTKPSSQLQEKINEIKKNNKTDAKRIKATLNFVQNEIRYLALSSGIGNYKPFSSNKIFNNRYGDCKDKSVLMVAILNEMNIEAYPMLINSSLKKTIIDLLPSHKLFDHCVVKVIDKAENEFWYDPTISNQGGDYKSTYFPDYRYGLVLKKGTITFDEIVSTASNEVEIIDNYVLEEVGKGADLTVISKYFENEADVQRNYYKQNSISSIKKEYENYFSNYFNTISATKNPEYKDDFNNNVFTVTEFYHIDSLWNKHPSIDSRIVAKFTPYTIVDILLMPNAGQERKTEFAQLYPATRRHKINIKLPEKWESIKEDKTINSKGFYYERSAYKSDKSNQLILKYYIQTQKDYIETSEIIKYTNDLKKLDSELAYQIYIDNNDNYYEKEGKNIFLFFAAIIIIIVIIRKIRFNKIF